MTYATAIAARHTGTGQITSLDMAALAGRVALSAIFILSGLSKLADPAGTIGSIQSVGLPVPQLAFLLAVAIEIVGGVVLIAGLRTSLFNAALATFSVVTAFGFHAELQYPNQLIHFFTKTARQAALLQSLSLAVGWLSLAHIRS